MLIHWSCGHTTPRKHINNTFGTCPACGEGYFTKVSDAPFGRASHDTDGSPLQEAGA